MLSRISVRKCLLGSILPFNILDSHDTVPRDSKDVQSLYEKAQEGETGWDRLHMMFSIDEFGNISPEVYSFLQSAFCGMFTGALYGGYIRSRMAYLDFMERNQATAFQSHFEAKKKLQDQVTISFAKGAFQWGWRLGLFTGSYVLLTTSIAVYRGKSSIWEYIFAGGMTGACYKVNMGLRGMLVGGILGSCLGTVAGGISLGLLKASGMTMEEVRFWQYKWKEARLKQTQKMIKEYKAQDELPIVALYDEKVKAMPGTYLDSLESPAEGTTTQQ